MPVGLAWLTEVRNVRWNVDLYPLLFLHLIFPLMSHNLSKILPCLSTLLSVSPSSSCSPGLVWYHACMHHEPANKLHRVATLLPLSLICQVEPLKHSPSSPLHPSLHLPIQPSPSLLAHHHAPHPPTSYTCTLVKARK